MAEYKGTKGFQVQTRIEDPTPYAQALANNPYAGSWSSGGDLNVAKRQAAGFGTLTAGLFAGGNNPPPTTANVEEYNGTAWSEVNDMPTSHFALASSRNSPQTSGIVFGGTDPSNSGVSTESDSYDGTNWTETAEINTGRKQLGGAGSSSTAALAFSGNPGPGVLTELWNGSAWTEVNDLNAQKQSPSYFGTSTAAIAAQGNPPATTTVESWNGTSWTEVAEMNTQRSRGAGMGTTTDGLVGGGLTPAPGNTAATEAWNGSAWTEVNDMGSARHELASGGTGSTGWAAGGYTSTEVATTEEWTFGGLDPSTTPAANYSDAIIGDFYYNSSEGKFKGSVSGSGSGTWASGANMNTARYRMQGGMGTYAAAYAVAGASPPKTNVENYNGTAWTEVNDVPSVRADVAAGGTATAGFALAGTPSNSQTLEWDGTNWTTGGAFPTTVARAGTFGSQTAFVAVGGASDSRSPSDQSVNTLEYDGSSWTTGNNYPTILANGGGSGTLTAGIMAAGYTPADSPGQHACTYDGTNWTQVADLNNQHLEHGFAQQSPGSATLNFGGPSTANANTEEWDGTSWTETNNLSTGREAGGSAGNLNNALYFGGSSPALSPTTTNVTEEWSQADFLNKLVTSS